MECPSALEDWGGGARCPGWLRAVENVICLLYSNCPCPPPRLPPARFLKSAFDKGRTEESMLDNAIRSTWESVLHWTRGLLACCTWEMWASAWPARRRDMARAHLCFLCSPPHKVWTCSHPSLHNASTRFPCCVLEEVTRFPATKSSLSNTFPLQCVSALLIAGRPKPPPE